MPAKEQNSDGDKKEEENQILSTAYPAPYTATSADCGVVYIGWGAYQKMLNNGEDEKKQEEPEEKTVKEPFYRGLKKYNIKNKWRE